MLSEFRFHHIGYAVHEISETAAYYINAGWQLSDEITDEKQNTKISFLTREGFPLIELVAPVDEKSPVVEILKKNGVTAYHVCYEVADIDEAISKLRKQQYVQLFKPVEAIALNNRKICYLYNNKTGLIEIIEKAG